MELRHGQALFDTLRRKPRDSVLENFSGEAKKLRIIMRSAPKLPKHICAYGRLTWFSVKNSKTELPGFLLKVSISFISEHRKIPKKYTTLIYALHFKYLKTKKLIKADVGLLGKISYEKLKKKFNVINKN